MTESERIQILNEARQFYLAAPVLLPLLERRKNDTINRLLSRHRDGDTKYDTLVSELAVLTNLQNEINAKESTYRILEEKKK